MNKVITVILAVMLIIVSSCIKSEDNHGNEDSNYIESSDENKNQNSDDDYNKENNDEKDNSENNDENNDLEVSEAEEVIVQNKPKLYILWWYI